MKLYKTPRIFVGVDIDTLPLEEFGPWLTDVPRRGTRP